MEEERRLDGERRKFLEAAEEVVFPGGELFLGECRAGERQP